MHRQVLIRDRSPKYSAVSKYFVEIKSLVSTYELLNICDTVSIPFLATHILQEIEINALKPFHKTVIRLVKDMNDMTSILVIYLTSISKLW